MSTGTPSAATLLAGLRASLPVPRTPELPDLRELTSELGHHDSELTNELCASRRMMLERITAGMTTQRWAEVAVVSLPPALLCPIQDVLEEHVVTKLADPHSSHIGDPYPHVVVALGTFWIEDGHHRVAAALRRGAPLIQVRLYAQSEELPRRMPPRSEVLARP